MVCSSVKPLTEEAMGFFTKDIKTLDDLFVHTLRDSGAANRQGANIESEEAGNAAAWRVKD